MPTLKRRVSFFDSPEGAVIKKELEQIVANQGFNTDSTYSADAEHHPDNLISFVDKHMNYLNVHPSIDPSQYIANLRLMTRRR